MTPQLVIFDCDGVLVDSEPIASRLTADAVTALGLPMTAEQAHKAFLGDTMTNIVARLEAQLGGPLPVGWADGCQRRLLEAFHQELKPIPGALETVRRLHEAGVTLAVGSQGRPEKMQLTLQLTGLLSYFEGRIFSAIHVPRPKPAPDLFLHAAASLGVVPEHSVVVEDSARGVAAGLAAGMRVFGYVGSIGEEAMRATGAEPIRRLEDLPALLGLTR